MIWLSSVPSASLMTGRANFKKAFKFEKNEKWKKKKNYLDYKLLY